MKIERLMTTRLITVDMDVTLKEIRDLFEKASFHHLLVTENGKLVGIISDRDILKWSSPFIGTLQERPADEHLLLKRAHQLMTRKPITLCRTESVTKALQLLVDNKLSSLPITNPDGSLAGIVTARDFLKFMLNMATNTL
ncbi:MAG: CBS domain-containing protein [Gammaproteobacteria bacterium]|nr:CBS domain-containing protein [Gammaproteobacteria bacterium]MBU2478106.1 CBS domain-containing protein [Gammaproteobacteria bacterium]